MTFLNIDNPFFDGILNSIYFPELKLIKAYNSDTDTSFVDLHISIVHNVIVSEIYDKGDNFTFDIVDYTHLDGDVLC